MTTRYEWTDWITHVPGQRLPNGTYGLFEFVGKYRDSGKPIEREGVITPARRDCPLWDVTNANDPGWCMLTRYKLRTEFDEVAVEREWELEFTP